jgi:hypothetical protein
VAAKAGKQKRAKKVTCEECFFRCNLLCALQVEEPCATFRPNRPEGLTPPKQLTLVFRQERRPQRLTPLQALLPAN